MTDQLDLSLSTFHYSASIAAMSLYSGIKFSLAEDSASAGIARTGKDDSNKDQGGSAGTYLHSTTTSIRAHTRIPTRIPS